MEEQRTFWRPDLFEAGVTEVNLSGAISTEEAISSRPVLILAIPAPVARG